MSDFALAIESTEEILDYAVLESEFENESQQRRLKHSSELIGWSLKSPALTLTGMLVYRDFFKGKYGALNSFTWTSHIDGVQYTVTFTKASFRITHEGGFYRVSWNFKRIV